MARSTEAAGDGAVTTFTIPARVVMAKRASEIGLGAYGLVMIAVFIPWGGPPPPDSIAHIVWPVLAVGVLVPAVFVWFRWKRIPPGAAGGTLHVGPKGIDYRVGPDHVALTWADVAAIHPVRRSRKPDLRAIWLPRDDPAPPNSSRMTLLEIAHVKSPYRPVLRPDGVLLPLQLFGTGKGTADLILAALTRHHGAAQVAATEAAVTDGR